MPRTKKARPEAARPDDERFRRRVIALLAEPDDWERHDHIREWLQKLLRRDLDYVYTLAEHAAVARIIAARTPFEDWGEYSVPELIRAAQRYVADYSYEDELFLNEINARGATRLALFDMRCLVGLCRVAGMDLPKFKPVINTFDEAA